MVTAEMPARQAEAVVRKWSASPSGVLILTHEKFRDWGEARGLVAGGACRWACHPGPRLGVSNEC